MGAALSSDRSSSSCFGSVWMLDCHSSVQTCSVFKSRSRAVDQIRNSAEKSNAVPRRPNRPIPKIDYLSAHFRENPRDLGLEYPTRRLTLAAICSSRGTGRLRPLMSGYATNQNSVRISLSPFSEFFWRAMQLSYVRGLSMCASFPTLDSRCL